MKGVLEQQTGHSCEGLGRYSPALAVPSLSKMHMQLQKELDTALEIHCWPRGKLD